MNLANYMAMTVTPLSGYTPACEQRQAEAQKKRRWKRNTENANIAKQNQSIARYREVMGTEWVKTRVIEERLGYCRSTASDVLTKWMKKELVERRSAGGLPHNPRDGYEWRFTPPPEEEKQQ